MHVAQVCSRNVTTVRRGDEIVTAAQLMRDRHIGYLVVVDPAGPGSAGKPVGVLTDRDIVVGVVARNVNYETLTVGDIMTSPPLCVLDTDVVEAAVREMRRIGVRRMPVVGSLGELKGVLSLDDILDAASSELRDLAVALLNEKRVEGVLRG